MLARISKKNKKELASMINSLQVAQYMADTSAPGPDQALWRNRRHEVTVRLYRDFGIELPTLHAAQKNMGV